MSVKLYAPEHPQGCHIALTNGHTFVVPNADDGAEVPTMFRREAIARGCLPVGMKPEQQDTPTSFERDTRVTEKIRMMMDGDDPSYFTGDGKPNLQKLSSICGFQVSREERDRLWETIEKDLE